MTEAPEPGTRARIRTEDGEEIAVYTGHMWASEDGSRIIANVESWKEEPAEGALEVKNLPEKLEEPPVGGGDEEEE